MLRYTGQYLHRRAHPELVDDAVRTVSVLMCSEAAVRSGNTPMEDDEEAAGHRADFGGSARKTALSFTDDKGAEKSGCAALDLHGPWMPDVADFERARRRRDAR